MAIGCGMNRIRELREKAGLSAERLADRVGTTQATISRLETGARRLTVSWMRRITDALQVRPEELIAPAPMPDFKADVEPAVVTDMLVKTALQDSGRRAYRVLTDACDNKGIIEGAYVVVDETKTSLDQLSDGEVVVASVYDIADLREPKLILRQFLAPTLLIPNSGHFRSHPIVDAAHHTVEIVGVVVRPKSDNGR